MRARWCLALVALVLFGCDKPKDTTEAGAAYATKPVGIDASGLGVDPSDPVAPAGDLKDEAEHVSSLEACVAERAKVDPLIGDAIRAIGYDTLFYDGCRTLLATRDRDVRACEPIVSSALRARCETLVAIAKGDVEACPRVRESTVVRGRSATCLAAASGDARLCQGEPKIARIHCEALVLRDEKRCDWLPSDTDRPGMGKRSCLRELTRLRALLPEQKVALPPLATAKATLKVTIAKDEGDGGAPTADGGESAPTIDVTPEVAQGLVIFPGYARREIFDRTRLATEIGTVGDSAPAFVAAGPTRGARIGLLLSFAKGGKDVRIERVELDLPGARSHLYPGERFKGAASFAKIDDVRGAEVTFSFSGELDGIKLSLEGTTFVRDVVATIPTTLPSPLLASPPDRDAGLPSLGDSPWLKRDASPGRP